MRYDIYFDGSCHNDGTGKTVMGVGIYARMVVRADTMGRAKVWEDVYKHSMNAGLGTNNIAEWLGLREAMIFAGYCVMKGRAEEINIYSDSKLVVHQFRGDWVIRGGGRQSSKDIFYEIFQEVKELEQELNVGKKIIRGVFWIPREENKEADILSKEGRDSKDTRGLLELDRETFKSKLLIKF